MVEKMAESTTYREPVGVVGCITPWNYPLGQVIQKIIPALLMGNTIILKPSQHTPLSAYWLVDAFEKAGFPKGVFNLVTGRGGEVGNALSSHPLVDMISFTGSTKGGVTVSKHALESVKRISLELGGKSPYVILKAEDHDYNKPIHLCFNTIFLNSGQTCTAFSRLLIPESEKETIEKQLVEIAKEYTVGDPEDHNVKLGPVSSRAQYDKITSYIKKGVEEGATLLYGEVPKDLGETGGYYIHPVIFTDVKNSMTIAQGIGTSMLQFGNICRRPQILIAPTLASAILGPISTAVFGMVNNAMGAGMGTSGLVGQFGAYSAMTAAGFSPAYTLFLILLMHVLLPAALSLGISELLRKIGWVRFGDQKLEL